MKANLLLLLVVSAGSMLGQPKVDNLVVPSTGLEKGNDIIKQQTTKTGKAHNTIKIVYKDKQKRYKDPVYIVNNQYAGKRIDWIKPDDIAQIDIIKQAKDSLFHNDQNSGTILITLKDSVHFHLMSLSAIKKNYVTTSSPLCIFMINNRVYSDNIEDCLVDEKSILQINVYKIESKNGNSGKTTDIDVIQILTDTKENIEKSKQIIIS